MNVASKCPKCGQEFNKDGLIYVALLKSEWVEVSNAISEAIAEEKGNVEEDEERVAILEYSEFMINSILKEPT